MNPELKAKWIAALRSGDYRQGRGMLKSVYREDTYCCLGVLCDVSGMGRWVHKDDDGLKSTYYEYHSHCSGGRLPWGMGSDIGLPAESQELLISMNDTDEHQKSFDEIADYIEKNL